MSLQVWLPLNGDLHNQGLDPAVFSKTTENIWGLGKIGERALLTSTGTNKIMVNGLKNKQKFSIAFWVKIDTTLNFTNYQDIWALEYTNATGTGSIRFEHTSTPGSCSLVVYKETNIGENNNAYYYIRGYQDYSNNVWYHLVLTKDQNSTKCYINGNLTNTIFNNQYEASLGKLTGNVTIGASTCAAYLNDVRIYDHCLSPKEIEEISKGLILHYPLNNNGLGNTNLALNTKNLNINGDISNLYMFKRGNATRQLRTDTFSEIKCTDSWQGIQVYANALNLSAGSKLTYSFYIYGNENSKKFYFYPMIYSSEGVRDTTTKIPISVDGSSYVSANSKFFTSTTTTTPKHHYVTFEWTQDLVDIIDNGGDILLTIQVYGTWDTGDWSCIFSPKLEFGEIPTPWAPAPSDIGYTNVIYDTSGYCNNGTIVGDITTIAPSPRYNCCIEHLDSCADYIYREYLSFLGDSGFTFSCWINPTSYSRTTNGTTAIGKQFILSQGRDHITSGTDHTYGASLIIYNGKPQFLCGNGSLYSNTTIPIGEWAHVVGVWTGTQKKIYINGVLKNSANDNKIDWSEAQNSLVIGKMAYGKSSSTTYHPFVGKISDVRIYATALTDSQIKELYNTSMQIDSSGNVFARELVEL